MSAAPAQRLRLHELDERVLAATLLGLPLTLAPYADLAATLGVTEQDVLDSTRRLENTGVLKRFGFVVRHHALGFRANGMCVFDVPDGDVPGAAARLKTLPFVTLCYRRLRRPPEWRYNLFCMIHGTDRAEVIAQFEKARTEAGLEDVPSAILFSRRQFKQCAGRYIEDPRAPEAKSRAA